MKFAYVDESGDSGQSDVFVMAGLLIDAYRLRKYTAQFDKMLSSFLARHPGAPKELKTKAFINGSGGWSVVDPDDRKNFLNDFCDLVSECAKVFALALSFRNFEEAAKAGLGHTFDNNYWLGSAMFVATLVQQKMQSEARNKGLTVFICDDNKKEMPKFSDALYAADPWFDPIYQTSRRKNGKVIWKPIVDGERLDHIINSAFALKSHHSSLIQVADAVSYIYRRHLELKSDTEAWVGEQEYFDRLATKLDERRARLGRTPGGPCIEFYMTARHQDWAL